MIHEQELVSAQTPPADQGRVDERWPVPGALLFITVVSVALWSLIILAADWLLG